jgi:hypothetical protein
MAEAGDDLPLEQAQPAGPAGARLGRATVGALVHGLEPLTQRGNPA